MEFPIVANVNTHVLSPVLGSTFFTIHGGSIRTFAFRSNVQYIQIILRTDGRPLNSRIELLQGPNNSKQVVELYTQDGFDIPFFCVLSTMGTGSVVRIINTSPVEFPLDVGVTEYR